MEAFPVPTSEPPKTSHLLSSLPDLVQPLKVLPSKSEIHSPSAPQARFEDSTASQSAGNEPPVRGCGCMDGCSFRVDGGLFRVPGTGDGLVRVRAQCTARRVAESKRAAGAGPEATDGCRPTAGAEASSP